MATETHFHKELDELKENLLMMAGLVEGAIRDALQSLDNPIHGQGCP